MTGNAFIKRLAFQLDFLNEDDQKTVISFYQRKLSNANTLLEEEAIVKSFGSPEHIAKKLKEAYFSHLAAAEKAEKEAKEKEQTANERDAFENDVMPQNAEDISVRDDDLIFSKPQSPAKAPEVIHSLENKEVKPLFGEKVVIEERTEPIEEIIIEPIDIENRLTEEEIQKAKEETLEKANNFTTASIVIPKELLDTEAEEVLITDSIPAETSSEPLESEYAKYSDDKSDDRTEAETTIFNPEAEDNDVACDPVTEEQIVETNQSESEEIISTEEPESAPSLSSDGEAANADSESKEVETDEDSEEEYVQEHVDSNAVMEEEPEITVSSKREYGVITKMFSSPRMPKPVFLFLTILVSVIISPLLFTVYGMGIITYALTLAFLILGAVLAFLLIALTIALGVSELIYGFSSMFDSIAVALIEIGIGTVVFGIVTALAAFIYELLFSIIPRSVRLISRLLVKYLKKISFFLYGGKA